MNVLEALRHLENRSRKGGGKECPLIFFPDEANPCSIICQMDDDDPEPEGVFYTGFIDRMLLLVDDPRACVVLKVLSGALTVQAAGRIMVLPEGSAATFLSKTLCLVDGDWTHVLISIYPWD